jgi:nitrogen fixation protein FixH
MWVELENFTGKSVLSVKQDFYARVLSSNLVAMMSNAAQRLIDRNTKGRRQPYQVNVAQAISKMKNTLVKLIFWG